MTVVTTIERSGPAIREALRAASPEECAAFESEFRTALDRASTELDLVPVQHVVDRWWGIAAIRANPLEAHEQAQVAPGRSGDLAGLWEQDESGAWT